MQLLVFYIVPLFAAIVTAGCTRYASPPKSIPDLHVASFTLNGTIPVVYNFVDDSFDGIGSHYNYSFDEIDQWVRFWKHEYTHSEKDLIFYAIQAFHDVLSGSVVGVCKL